MVYYIRFLKLPKYDASKDTVRALMTVTTDLGDDFYPGSLTLYSMLKTSQCEMDRQSKWHTAGWKAGMRTIWIEIQNLRKCPSVPLQFIVNTKPTLEADCLSHDEMPEVLSVQINSFGQNGRWEDPRADSRIQRKYKTASGHENVIFEETGDSIARHLW